MKLFKQMKSIKKAILLAILPILLIISLASISTSNTDSSKIGILVFDGFLTSDVTAPVEVFGAATKKVQYDQNVVTDSNVITSNGGPVSYQSAFELLAKLSSEEFSNEIAESIQFNRLERAFES